MATYGELAAAVDEGAVKRIRPKMMTIMAILFSLVPLMWSTGSFSCARARSATTVSSFDSVTKRPTVSSFDNPPAAYSDFLSA